MTFNLKLGNLHQKFDEVKSSNCRRLCALMLRVGTRDQIPDENFVLSFLESATLGVILKNICKRSRR